MIDDKADTVERLRIGHDMVRGKSEELGVIALRSGQIEIESGDRERLARLLAGMFHSRYKNETELFHSLPQRLNNGYMWARTDDAEGIADKD